MKRDLDGINTDSIKELTEWAVKFRDERDWKGHHTAKNLAANTCVEAAELLDHYRFDEEPKDKQGAADEAADVLHSLLLFCEAAGIDLSEAAAEKWRRNGEKYPVGKFQGSTGKYDGA